MDYNAVNTKALAMGSKLLKLADYNALSQLATVEDVGLKLKELSAYHVALETIATTDLRRTNIEHKLILSLTEDYEKLYKFLCDAEGRRFLDALFLKTEVYILKILLCSIYDSHEIDYSIPELTALLGRKLKIDITKLKNSKSVSDFIENLNGTMFYKPLHDVYTESSMLYELEVQLDLQYYIYLWGLLKKGFGNENTLVLRQVLGLETDLLNIAWIYRLKAFYKVPDVKIYSHLIPFYHRLTKKSIIRMVESKTIDSLREEISKTPYAQAFHSDEKPEKIFDVEMVKQLKRVKEQNPNSLAPALAYLYLKNIEISNITTLIECVRYELDSNEITKYLTIARGTGVS